VITPVKQANTGVGLANPDRLNVRWMVTKMPCSGLKILRVTQAVQAL
jgi:hypothetical protein